jgi:hypothetical protein
MPDLRDRFRAADRMPSPDLWDEIRWRSITGPSVVTGPPRTPARVATIVVAFAIFIAVALVFGGAFRGSVHAPAAPTPASPPPTPVPPPPPPVREGSELPPGFPATLALPDGLEPVASRTCCGYMQVWFRDAAQAGDLESWFRLALRRRGWTISGRETPLVGWRLFAVRAAADQTATVVGGGPGASPRDGSDAFDGGWDLYIIVYG